MINKDEVDYFSREYLPDDVETFMTNCFDNHIIPQISEVFIKELIDGECAGIIKCGIQNARPDIVKYIKEAILSDKIKDFSKEAKASDNIDYLDKCSDTAIIDCCHQVQPITSEVMIMYLLGRNIRTIKIGDAKIAYEQKMISNYINNNIDNLNKMREISQHVEPKKIDIQKILEDFVLDCEHDYENLLQIIKCIDEHNRKFE